MFGGNAVVSNEKDRILGVKAPRRTVLKGATGAAAGLAAAGIVGKSAQSALAQDDVKSQILAIPGAGKGQPTEQDMQKVGELCLGPTKANVQQGEFKGVELTFLGLNNQNLHDIVFRTSAHVVRRLHRRSRSTGSTWRRPTTTPACSRLSRPRQSTSTLSKWALRTRAMSAAQGSLP